MQEIVAADEPIRKVRVPLQEARAYFESIGADDKLRLLEYRDKDYLVLYTLRGQKDYYYGYMVPSTGYLTTFSLQPYSRGSCCGIRAAKTPASSCREGSRPSLRRSSSRRRSG